MALLLDTEYAILCEGAADKVFLEHLIAYRSLPLCNIFECSGVTKIGTRLKAIAGDAVGFSRLKGVLIIVDSAAELNRTFDLVRDQILQAKGFPVPSALGVLTREGSVPLKVIFLPDDLTPGGLETLYVEQICLEYPGLPVCVDQFLSCGTNNGLSLSAEKLGKARFACIVAAINAEDPSKAASYIFSARDIIKLGSIVYDGVFDKLNNFFAETSV